MYIKWALVGQGGQMGQTGCRERGQLGRTSWREGSRDRPQWFQHSYISYKFLYCSIFPLFPYILLISSYISYIFGCLAAAVAKFDDIVTLCFNEIRFWSLSQTVFIAYTAAVQVCVWIYLFCFNYGYLYPCLSENGLPLNKLLVLISGQMWITHNIRN